MQQFIPFKPEKEVISIRLNTELLKKIDAAAESAQISRNEFINQCIIFAMEHLGCDRDK
ncbi:MAG: type II toxin-antitoxin system HicB family antitoxin [Firmicutes bacterium]|nr:type II toxin-antitoxin system HicB family antitoxin [Bacillota bacterium]